ncbi:sulfite exporter TauE/SafE family protein [Tardiphaga sp.]|uniref:sulfite exporter TauE/SafE family protein n=1 Tax=Tardiphaga sp. TaxID=1926292 RepID=UPI00262BCFD9|nr:sulfite exporter TauE/SafE family protein [Tardiphaga sp.]MDB5617337.1 putative rane transporter protein [Tardiphaga sp.]
MPDLFLSLDSLGPLLTPRLICLSIAAVFAAAILRGFTGFGFALAAVPLLGLFMSPTQAVPVSIGLQLLGSLIDFRHATKSCHWPSLRWMMLGAAIGSPLGALVLNHVPAPVARLVISAITMMAVFALGRGFALAAMPGRVVTTITGLLAGLFNGLAAMPGPPAVAYYMSAPLPRTTVRASLVVFFLLTSVAAMASGIAIGLITVQTLCLSLLGLPAMWIGTRVGHMAFVRSNDAMHRHVSIISLGIIALVSAAKGISELL